MSLNLKSMAASAATAAVFGVAANANAASAISIEDTEFGRAYVPEVKVGCEQGGTSVRLVDYRRLDKPEYVGDKRVVVNMDSDISSRPDNGNNRGGYVLQPTNCKSVVLPQSDEAFGSTVLGDTGDKDIGVFKNRFVNVTMRERGPSDLVRVFIDANIATVNLQQNGSRIDVRYNLSGSSQTGLTSVLNVGQICAKDGSVVLPSNNAAQATFNGPCTPGFNARPFMR